jgi:predicted SAM-dependent methyltransferase
VLRVLDPGGCFRIVVPDAELIVRRYIESPDDLVAYRAAGDGTPMEVVNLFFRQRYEHQFLYDWPTMERMLRRAGFSHVKRASFRNTDCRPEIALDDPKYEWESLYVDARKS